MFNTMAAEFDYRANERFSSNFFNHIKADREFDRTYARGWITRHIARFFPQNFAMKELSNALQQKQVYDRHEEGIQRVKISEIVGSESKAYKFDRRFTPLYEDSRERWVRVAQAYLDGGPIPPVQLIRLGCDYYVRDGHHRVSVARSLGAEYVDADVTAWEIGPLPECRPAAFQVAA
jgi:hypothetical protein